MPEYYARLRDTMGAINPLNSLELRRKMAAFRRPQPYRAYDRGAGAGMAATAEAGKGAAERHLPAPRAAGSAERDDRAEPAAAGEGAGGRRGAAVGGEREADRCEAILGKGVRVVRASAARWELSAAEDRVRGATAKAAEGLCAAAGWGVRWGKVRGDCSRMKTVCLWQESKEYLPITRPGNDGYFSRRGGALAQEARKRLQRRFGDVVLDALGVLFGRFRGDADRTQQIDHQPVARLHAGGERFAGLGEEHAAIRARGGQPLALHARDRFDGGGVGDAEAARDVGGARLAPRGQQVGDQFGVVLQQRVRLRRSRLAEAARLRGLGRHL